MAAVWGWDAALHASPTKYKYSLIIILLLKHKSFHFVSKYAKMIKYSRHFASGRDSVTRDWAIFESFGD